MLTETFATVTVAETILDQMGGRRFCMMTGARDFTSSGDGLTMRLPSNFAKDGINCVRVTLNGLDTYDVDFLKVRGTKVAIVECVANVYADQLRAVFTRATGLDTRM